MTILIILHFMQYKFYVKFCESAHTLLFLWVGMHSGDCGGL